MPRRNRWRPRPDNSPLVGLDLTKIIIDIFPDLQDPHHGDPYRSKANKVINAIIHTIAMALRRGEDVKIDGFGIFKIFEHKARKAQKVNFFYKGKLGDPYLIDIPARKVVTFKPSKTILKVLNAEESKDE